MFVYMQSSYQAYSDECSQCLVLLILRITSTHTVMTALLKEISFYMNTHTFI